LRKRKVIRQVAGKAVRLLLAAFVAWNLAQAANITIAGSWSRVIGAGDLLGGPGSNLGATYTSATNQVTMGVTTGANMNWRVDVRRIDTIWHANFVLSIRRTNNGTAGNGTVAGGTTYLQITTTSRTFVTGRNNRTGITLQEQLGGVSVSIPVATYTTTIQYTVVDT
jgi:hypothetical protein